MRWVVPEAQVAKDLEEVLVGPSKLAEAELCEIDTYVLAHVVVPVNVRRVTHDEVAQSACEATLRA